MIEDMINYLKEDIQHFQKSLEENDLPVYYLKWAKLMLKRKGCAQGRCW